MRRRGFTLIEMTVTAAISGVLLLALAFLFRGSGDMIGRISQDVNGSLADRTARAKAVFGAARECDDHCLPTGLARRVKGDLAE